MLRIVIGLLVVFYLPGFALSKAMFPAKSLSISERLLLSLGLSLTIVVLGGFLLNWLPGGLQTITWSIMLILTILGASLVSLVRKSTEKSINLGNCNDLRMIIRGASVSQVVLLGLAFLVIIGAIWVARTGAIQQKYTNFTQLWMLPNDSIAPNTIRLGVNSMEQSEISFKLLLKSGKGIVFESYLIELKPGEKWEKIVQIPTQLPNVGLIEADLFRLDEPDVIYRMVKLWHD